MADVARVTLQTVADRVGVSRMTVSNAFSKPDQLSDTLRQRILETAAELGYVGPDPAARALARGTSGAVGVLLTSSLPYAFTDDVAMGFLGAVADELAPTGLALTLLPSTSRDQVVPARDVALDGALIYSCDPDTTAADWLIRRGLPVVFVDQEHRPDISSVNVDDRSGARAAAQHVVDLGHRRIGVMTTGLRGVHGIVADPIADVATWKRVGRERMLGYLDVLTPLGIEPVVYRQLENSDTEAREAARELLSVDERPTAVLCYSDVLAHGVVGSRRGPRAQRARRPVGGRVRRQPAGQPGEPRADHRPPGRRGQGPGRRRRPHRRHAGRPQGRQGRARAGRPPHRAGGPRQHRPAAPPARPRPPPARTGLTG